VGSEYAKETQVMSKKEQIIEQWATGQFKTQAELAKFLSVTTAYVSNVLIEAEGRTPQKKIVNGDFDLKGYLRGNLPEIAKVLVHKIKTGKGTKSIEVALKALGELVEKREDTLKLEYTPADHTRIARETIIGLREEYQQLGGICPVCNQSKALRIEARLDTEPEQPEDREVATVALPARPD